MADGKKMNRQICNKSSAPDLQDFQIVILNINEKKNVEKKRENSQKNQDISNQQKHIEQVPVETTSFLKTRLLVNKVEKESESSKTRNENEKLQTENEISGSQSVEM